MVDRYVDMYCPDGRTVVDGRSLSDNAICQRDVTTVSQVVVCVPARNEVEHLPTLLAALAPQTLSATVLVALNNTTDGSIDVVEMCARQFSNLRVIVDDVTFPHPVAHAGNARRRAMDLGAAVAGDDGILITTDADARPPPDWIFENVSALKRGLEIVGGRIVIDNAEDVAEPIRAMLAATSRYWVEVRAIEDAIDPLQWDPPPRHGDHTGASLAMRVADYVGCGGVPLVPSGEDRALVQAVCSRGGKLGHPSAVWTRVSARTIGRAEAGMAAAMARMSQALQDGMPLMLPNYRHWELRAWWRKGIRDRFGSAEVALQEAALAPMPCDMIVFPIQLLGQALA